MKPSASCTVSSFELVGHLERYGSSYQFLQYLVVCVQTASNCKACLFVQFALASVIAKDFTDSYGSYGILTDRGPNSSGADPLSERARENHIRPEMGIAQEVLCGIAGYCWLLRCHNSGNSNLDGECI